MSIDGAFLIEMEEIKDERGSFARQFCKREMQKAGIDFEIRQCNFSKNCHIGVLRGLHYQKQPYPEIKMVSCFSGAVYDVIVDIRQGSPTYLKWEATILSGINNKIIYIPPDVVHGFQTLEENSSVYYQLSEFFMPDYYAGMRWDDPKLNIEWPACNHRIINGRDSMYALLK